jgi:hypothetical protein
LHEIFLSKYFTDIPWKFYWKRIAAGEDQFEGARVFNLEANTRNLLWIRINFSDYPACVIHCRLEKACASFGIGRKEHALMNRTWMRT